MFSDSVPFAIRLSHASSCPSLDTSALRGWEPMKPRLRYPLAQPRLQNKNGLIRPAGAALLVLLEPFPGQRFIVENLDFGAHKNPREHSSPHHRVIFTQDRDTS